MGIVPVRWGILSTAAINRLVIPAAKASPAVELLAVASRDPVHAEEYAAEWKIDRAYGSYEALLADPDVEAVYISLPNSMHHEWTMRALDAGKHVLCEKPYSRRAKEAVQAFDAAEREGLVLCEAFMWRHSPQTHKLLELLPEIGELQAIRATFGFVLEDETNVRMQAELDGGSLMDVGCYCVNAARLLAGEEPERVYGEQVVGPTGVDVRFTGMLRFPSGVLAELSSFFTAEHMSLEAIGTKGSLSLADPWHARRPLIVVNGEKVRLKRESSYRLELENVSEAIRGKGKLLLGRDDAVGQARTLEALYRSAESGEPVTL